MSSDAFIYCSGYNFKEMISTMGGYLSLKLEDGVVKKSSILFSMPACLIWKNSSRTSGGNFKGKDSISTA